MRDLSVTQEYVICIVDEKGKISGLSSEKAVCFVAAAILELRMERCIVIDAKKTSVTGSLPADRQYLKPLYDFISQKKQMKLSKILGEYCLSLTNKRYHELLDEVGASLVKMGLVQERKIGLLGNKKGYTPAPETVRSVVEGLRSELLEEGKISEEAAALAILLERAKCLKQYFSKFEQKEIKEKVRVLMDSPEGKLVKEIADYIETILVIVSASGASAV